MKKTMQTKRSGGRIGRGKGLSDLYKYYISDKEKGTVLWVDRKTYTSIIKAANTMLADYILNESYHIVLPYLLGRLRIVKKRLDFAEGKLPIDWAATKKYGKRIFHTNEHTNEYKYRWLWDKHHSNVKHSNYYSFIPCRTNSRKLAQSLFNKIDYIE